MPRGSHPWDGVVIWIDAEGEFWICNTQIGDLSTILLALGRAQGDLQVIVDIDRALAMGITSRDDHIDCTISIDIGEGDLSSAIR